MLPTDIEQGIYYSREFFKEASALDIAEAVEDIQQDFDGNTGKYQFYSAEKKRLGGGIYDFYETADGKFMSVGSLEPKFFAALCIGMGHPEWKDGKILRTDGAMVKETFRTVFKTKARGAAQAAQKTERSRRWAAP